MSRIRRNLELCDLVRFDHFRGFSDYWEVPYGEKTAVKGKWMPAPVMIFLTDKRKNSRYAFYCRRPWMIDEKVYKLRDDFSCREWLYLQFAFGDNTPRSVYIPHNQV